jgi:phosphate transport system substrate-binding protein
MKRFVVFLLSLYLCVTVSAQGITVKGSTTLQPVAEKWAGEYTKANPKTQVRVLGGGSGKAFECLSAGECDLGTASRKIKPEEAAAITSKRGNAPVEYKVALDGVAIFVNSNNPIQKLDKAQLADIFTGKITNWSQVGGKNLAIKFYNRDTNSGTYGFVKEHLLKGADFAANAVSVPGSSQVILAVAGDPGGIGYGSIEFGKNVRHLKVSESAGSPAIAPELTTIRSGEYPLSRGLFIYSAGAAAGAPKDFLKFVASEKGQSLAESVGLFALSAGDRSKLAAALK